MCVHDLSYKDMRAKGSQLQDGKEEINRSEASTYKNTPWTALYGGRPLILVTGSYRICDGMAGDIAVSVSDRTGCRYGRCPFCPRRMSMYGLAPPGLCRFCT